MTSILLVGWSCSFINPESREYYDSSHGKIRHGLIPIDSTSSPAVQLRPVNLELVQQGLEVYNNHCLKCHGVEGRSSSGAPNLRAVVQEVPNFDFFISFSEYKGSMPGWKNPLTSTEKKALIEYLKSLVN